MQLDSPLSVFQYHPSIVPADALGNSIHGLHRRLLSAGIRSELFNAAPAYDLTFAGVQPLPQMLQRRWSADELLIVHYSFLDANLDRILSLPVRKILVYHNITPGHFFDGVGFEGLRSACDAARLQIAATHGLFDAVVAVSDYNGVDLPPLGEKQRVTIPVFFDFGSFRQPIASPDLFFNLKRQGALNLLFVGRFVPNKRHDKLIATVAELKRLVSQPVRLHLVGKVWNEDYVARLVKQAADLNVLADLNLRFDAPLDEVRTLFAAADAFVSLSEHEGFMVPVLEAFAAGCPVVADPGTAVGETMGYAGAPVSDGSPGQAAGLIALLARDRVARATLIATQARRAQDFAPDKVFVKWLSVLRTFGPVERARR